jgi:mRNA-degrading endonuclease RelE of RelBE toxin-antitoxin system
MSYTLVIKSEVIKETTEIYAFYKEIGQQLADRFDKELDARLKEVERRPARYPIRKKNYRHVQLKKFPYRVVYALIGQEVVVFQVRHTSRKPSKKFGP